MPTVTITFNQPINVSAQVGDTVYYCPTSTVGGFATAAQTTIVEIGTIASMSTLPDPTSIVCNIGNQTTPPDEGDYIFFSKDSQANMSSLLGYYAEIKLQNNSTEESELFSVGAEIFESSK